MKYHRSLSTFNNNDVHYGEFRFNYAEYNKMGEHLQSHVRCNALSVYPPIRSGVPTTYRIREKDENEFCNKIIDFYERTKKQGIKIEMSQEKE